MPAHSDQSTPPPLTPSQEALAAKLRKGERWVIVAAIIGLGAMIFIAWQWVKLSAPTIARDGVLSREEAAFWERTDGLVGLTIAEAQRLMDAPVEPVGDGSLEGRSPIGTGQPPLGWLRLTLDAGRITRASVEDAPAK